MLKKLIGTTAILALSGWMTSAHAIIINYGELGTGSAASVAAGGVIATGSSDVFFSDTFSTSSNGGLGVAGGGSNQSLDLGETLTFAFSSLASSVLLTTHDIPPIGNVTFGFTAFDGVTNLGFFQLSPQVTNPEAFDLSSFVGQAFDSFTLSLSVSAPLGLVIERLEYTPSGQVSSPATLGLFGFGLAGLGWSRRKKA